MNAKLWVCVIVGVLVAHLSVLFIVDNIRTAKKPPPPPAEPGFTTVTTTFTNQRGEKVRESHEFTVQTELATPALLGKLPAPPKPDAAEPAKSVSPAAAN